MSSFLSSLRGKTKKSNDNDTEDTPLLNDAADNNNNNSYDANKDNNDAAFQQQSYELDTPQGLARLVSEQQVGALAAYQGVAGLSDALSVNDIHDKDAMRAKYGSNALPLPPAPRLLELVWSSLADPTLVMLMASACVSLILGLGVERDFERGWIEGTSILVTIALVVGVTAGTDYVKAQEFRQQQLQLESHKQVQVLRNETYQKLHPKELVVGDWVRMQVGDILPADGVLVQGSADLKMDESALTGETQLVPKQVYSPENGGAQEEEVDPFLVSGTNVMQGSGVYMVLAVGVHSIQGKILARIREQDDETGSSEDATSSDEDEGAEATREEPNCCVSLFQFGNGDDDSGATLMEKLDKLAMDIGKMGLLVAAGVFVVLVSTWAYRKVTQAEEEAVVFGVYDISTLLEYFITAITILVVAVPEGLPLAVTLALAVSMRRMMKDANQVKHMDSTETMGSATTICSDKTGTLTENKMTAMKASYAGQVYEHVVGQDELKKNKKNKKTPLSLGAIMQQAWGDQSSTSTQSQLLAEAVLLNVSPTSKVSTNSETGKVQYEGNPTDCALIQWAAQLGYDDPPAFRIPYISANQHNNGRGSVNILDWGVHQIPFSSERKKMSWIVALPKKPGKFRLYCKGAPQHVLDLCVQRVTSVNDETGAVTTTPLDATQKHDALQQVQVWQEEGLRTLALAYRNISRTTTLHDWTTNQEEWESKLTLLALVGIEDPLRASVPGAIMECHKAGIDVRMCTGDALSTGIAIAKGCNILRRKDLDSNTLQPKKGFCMTGAEFDDLVHKKNPNGPKVVRRVFDATIGDAVDQLAEPFLLDDSGNKVLDQVAFDQVWPTLRVLARCQPEDKLTLVRGMRKSRVFLDEARCAQLYEEHGIRIFPDYQVVAVTGDGTNDAPALKAANVGFAMGIAGTETAKQACDIILLDDNFASIIKAVMWGRNVFDSISKFIQFQLTVNVVAITLAVIGAFSYSESPLSAVQMLWVNMIMDSLASLALATEQPTKELLDRMPYGKRRPVISPVMMSNIIGHSVYQISILCWVLFKPETLPIIDPPLTFEPTKGSLNWSVFFNVFVMLQLFNEFNARRLPTPEKLRTTLSEWNIWDGMFRNPMFVSIMIITFSFQAVLVEFGGEAVNVVPGGLSQSQWIFCVGAGVGGLIWQLVINLVIVVFAPAPFETQESDNRIQSARKMNELDMEAVLNMAPPKETTASNWEKVRLGVRREILYARVFRMSIRSGVNLTSMIKSRDRSHRSEEYYTMLAQQMTTQSRRASASASAGS